MTAPSYSEFLARRAQLANAGGFDPTVMPGHLFDFQRDLVHWSVRQGRAAIFADCGMGKTPMSLAWAQNVHEHTSRPVRTKPGERVLTPFMGVGSEVYVAVQLGRYGIGAELKPTYYEQAERNLASIGTGDLAASVELEPLFGLDGEPVTA